MPAINVNPMRPAAWGPLEVPPEKGGVIRPHGGPWISHSRAE